MEEESWATRGPLQRSGVQSRDHLQISSKMGDAVKVVVVAEEDAALCYGSRAADKAAKGPCARDFVEVGCGRKRRRMSGGLCLLCKSVCACTQNRTTGSGR